MEEQGTGGPRAAQLAAYLRRRGIRDPRVLGAIARVPREEFVGRTESEHAYEDRALPIGCHQTISQPYVVARMSELLSLGGEERVLELGTGSGYQAAVLANLAREVYSIERHEPLAARARARLRALGLENVTIRVGDGTLGWPDEAPFDAIIVTAAAPAVPPPIIDQLAEGGRLVAPIGSARRQELTRVYKREDGRLERSTHGGVRFVPLLGRHGWSPDET